MPSLCSPSMVLAVAWQLDRGERDPSANRTERPVTRRPELLTASCNTLPGNRNDGGEHAALARRSTYYADLRMRCVARKAGRLLVLVIDCQVMSEGSGKPIK